MCNFLSMCLPGILQALIRLLPVPRLVTCFFVSGGSSQQSASSSGQPAMKSLWRAVGIEGQQLSESDRLRQENDALQAQLSKILQRKKENAEAKLVRMREKMELVQKLNHVKAIHAGIGLRTLLCR